MTEPPMYSPVPTRWPVLHYQYAPEGQQYYTAEYIAWAEEKYRRAAQEPPHGAEAENVAPDMQPRRCAVCERVMTGVSTRAKVCSSRCKAVAKAEQQRARKRREEDTDAK